MQFVVETGEGLPNSTSYSSTEAADDFAVFWDRSEWIDLSQQDKERYLIQATRIIDTKIQFPKGILQQSQALQWPRENFIDVNGRVVRGLPDAIVEATIRVAMILSTGWNYNTQQKILKAQSYGSSSETYLGGYVEGRDSGFEEWSEILEMLKALGLGGKSMRQVNVIRG